MNEKFLIKQKILNRIILYEIIGIVIIILTSWITAVLDPPYYILKLNFKRIDIYETLFETGIIILIGVFIIYWTKKIIKEIKYLESFLTVCASSKKIRINNEWVSMEEFFSKNTDIQLSHGICQSCAQRIYGEFLKDIKKDDMK